MKEKATSAMNPTTNQPNTGFAAGGAAIWASRDRDTPEVVVLALPTPNARWRPTTPPATPLVWLVVSRFVVPSS
jgi:hypothetical protein